MANADEDMGRPDGAACLEEEPEEERETPLWEQVHALMSRAEEVSWPALAKMLGVPLDVRFRMAFQKAADALRRDGVCEFAPIPGAPQHYRRTRGMKTMERANITRRRAFRGLIRASHKQSTIKKSDLSEEERHQVSIEKQRTDAMVASTALLSRRRRFDPTA